MFDSKFNDTQLAIMRHSIKKRASLGFSLIELMISLTIGLIITIAALSAYLGSSTASKVGDAHARMNEDAQAALTVLAQQIRLAGANPAQSGRTTAYLKNPIYPTAYLGGNATAYPGTGTITYAPSTYTYALANNTPTYAIRGCDGTFSNVTGTTTINLKDLTCGGTSTLPDSIGVSYEADIYNTVKTSASLPSDCVGSKIDTVTITLPAGNSPTSVTTTVADNRFYIYKPTSGSSTGIPSLYCKGNGSTTQPLVENIEDLQLTYGTVSASTTGTTATVAGYLTANEIENNSALKTAIPSSANRWGRVLTVRICVVVRSESPIAQADESTAYYKCDGTLDSTQTDRRLRRAYSTTVVLRNRRS